MQPISARVMVPVRVTPAILGAGTNVPEPNPANGEIAWVSAGTYVVGDTRTYEGVIWYCVKDHTGRTAKPDEDFTYWKNMAPTSRMAPFDDYQSTKSRGIGEITYVLNPGFVNGVKVYGPEGASYSITARDSPGGAVTKEKSGDLFAQAAGFWELLFAPLPRLEQVSLDDIPISPGTEITVTISSSESGPVAVGDIKVGDWRLLTGNDVWGGTEYGAEAQRKSYTYRQENDDGTYKIVPRSSARNVTCRIMLDAEEAMYADSVLGEIIDVAVPFEASNLPRYGYLNTLGFVSGSVRAESWNTASLNLTVKGNI